MSDARGPSLLTKVKIVGLAVAALLVLIVALQNTEAVETKVLFTTVTVPRVVLLFVMLLVGYVVGIFTAIRIVGRKSE